MKTLELLNYSQEILLRKDGCFVRDKSYQFRSILLFSACWEPPKEEMEPPLSHYLRSRVPVDTG